MSEFVLMQTVPRLREARPRAIADGDPAATLRLRQVLNAASKARTRWREEWFNPETRKSQQALLAEIEDNYRRIGPPLSLEPVEPEADAAAGTRRYRAVFKQVIAQMRLA